MTKLSRRLLVVGVLNCILYGALYCLQNQFAVPPSVNSRRFELLVVAGYFADILAIFGIYIWVLKSVLRKTIDDPLAEKLLWFFPALLCVAFVFCKPLFSEDLWAYLSSGYYSNLPGGNTYLHLASDVVNFPVVEAFRAQGVVPRTGVTPYGPIWSFYEMFVMSLTSNLGVALMLMKAGINAAILVSAVLIRDTVKRLDPERRQWSGFAFLWNPLILVEVGLEGHNDICMIMLMVLALNLAVRNKLVSSVVALWLGVLCKFLPLIYLPSLAGYFWRSRRRDGAFLAQVALAGVCCVVITVLLYWHFWVGAQTFQGVADMRERTQVTLSFFLERVLGFVLPGTYPLRVATLLVDGSFFAMILWISFNVKAARELTQAWTKISMAYLFVGSKLFWPWYPDTPLVLGAVSGGGYSNFLVILVPFLTRCVAPMSPLRNAGWLTVRQGGYWYVTLGVILPGAILLALVIRDLANRQQISQA